METRNKQNGDTCTKSTATLTCTKKNCPTEEEKKFSGYCLCVCVFVQNTQPLNFLQHRLPNMKSSISHVHAHLSHSYFAALVDEAHVLLLVVCIYKLFVVWRVQMKSGWSINLCKQK